MAGPIIGNGFAIIEDNQHHWLRSTPAATATACVRRWLHGIAATTSRRGNANANGNSVFGDGNAVIVGNNIVGDPNLGTNGNSVFGNANLVAVKTTSPATTT